MKKQTFLLFFLSWVVMVSLVACGGAAPSTSPASPANIAPDGKTLVETRCTACHSLSRIQQKHNAGDWAAIVTTMVRRGAQLNYDEKAAVTQYLVANYSQ